MSTSTELLDLRKPSEQRGGAARRLQKVMAALSAPSVSEPSVLAGVAVGELVVVTRNGHLPLVRLSGANGHSVVRARASVDLHGQHVGRSVVVAFEGGDSARPIVIGLLQGEPGWPLADKPDQVDVDADGQRMLVSARHELVLRCGQASITLTQSGLVRIQGTQIVSCASGSHHIQGGTVDIN